MFKKILLLVLMIAPMTVFAQKFAHYNTEQIAKTYPAYTAAQKELEDLSNAFRAELEEMQKELQKKYEKAQSEINESTPENIRQRRLSELDDMQQRIQEYYQKSQQDLEQKQAQLMQPIMEKFRDAVDAVLKEGGYVYGIDKSIVQGIAINETLSTDITEEIKKKLGI